MALIKRPELKLKQVGKLGRKGDVHDRRMVILRELDGVNFMTTFDLGGTDNSTHSNDLRQLSRWGYVETRKLRVRQRSNVEYRRTIKGTNFIRGLRL